MYTRMKVKRSRKIMMPMDDPTSRLTTDAPSPAQVRKAQRLLCAAYLRTDDATVEQLREAVLMLND